MLLGSKIKGMGSSSMYIFVLKLLYICLYKPIDIGICWTMCSTWFFAAASLGLTRCPSLGLTKVCFCVLQVSVIMLFTSIASAGGLRLAKCAH